MNPNTPPPALSKQPTASDTTFPSPEELAEIESETGYSQQKIMQDVQNTGATDKQTLYPQFYGEGRPGIMPDAAQAAGGYEEAQPNQGDAQPQSEPDGDEPPQRLAARAAMSGQPMPPRPTAGPPEENLLGLGAKIRKPSDVRDRARRMPPRRY